MFNETTVDHGQQALASVIGCCAYHSWAQDDMASFVPVYETVAHLERHSGKTVYGFIRAFSVRRG